MAVEVIWPHVFAKHDIIIEVNELLGEPWDAVDVGLNGRRAERGKVAVVLEDILEDKVKQMDLINSKHFFHKGCQVLYKNERWQKLCC